MPDDSRPIGNAPAIVQPRQKPPQTVGEVLQREDESTKRLTAVATRYLPAERAMRLAINAVRRTPKLAACDPTSFMGALMGATGLGLEPNTPKGHAFLIPYEQRRPRRENGRIVTGEDGRWIYDSYYECQLQIGYKGFVALFYRNPQIVSVTAEAIYAGDKFENRQGTEAYLRYEKALTGRGDELLGSFCFTKLQDGQAFTVLPADEIYKLRSRSQTWRSLVDKVRDAETKAKETSTPANQRALARAEATLAETPWIMWEDQMAAKSAIRRHAKQQDLGVDESNIGLAADLDALEDAGAIDIRAMADPEFAKEVVAGNEPLAPEQQQTEDDQPATADSGAGTESSAGATGASQQQSKGAESAGEPARPAGEPEAEKKPAQPTGGGKLF